MNQDWIYQKEIFIFGAGRNAIKFARILKDEHLYDKVKGYIDNDACKCGKIFEEKTVFFSNELQAHMEEDVFVVLSLTDSKAVEEQLMHMGISKNRIIPANDYLDALSEKNILHIKRKKKDGDIIRVGFIVQEIQIWNKTSLIYERMLRSEQFEPLLLVVPEYDFVKHEISPTSQFSQYRDRYKTEKIYELSGAIDIDDYKLDYLFLPSPYDDYLPNGLTSAELARKVLLCYIPYGYIGADNFIFCNTERRFFRNIYINFVHTGKLCQTFLAMFRANIARGSKKIRKLGYPLFDPCVFSDTHGVSKKIILWTPRWSYDPVLGGSHFFEYKDFISNLQSIYPDYQIVIRPHPMMFDNFISKGLMSKEAVYEYKKTLQANGIVLDEKNGIDTLVDRTMVLITDFSTIIADFFISGCPIIYCHSPLIQLNDEYKEMMRGCYIAENEEEIRIEMEKIIYQNDPLQGERSTIRKKLANASRNVIDEYLHEIESDFREH